MTMRSVVDPSEYPTAWASYRFRWILLRLSVVPDLVLGTVAEAAHLFWLLAILIGVTPTLVCQVWLMLWRCPRCGLPFAAPGHVKRAQWCAHCGLRRDSIPDRTSYSTW